jgi:hypothetical protein
VLFVGWDGNEFKGMAEARSVWERLRAARPGLELVWVTPRAPLRPMGRVVVNPPQAELAALYRGASVYLCASRYESFPLPPLEAMASGAPVVSTGNVGVLEYARDGDNALVVPIGDVEAMCAALGRVLDEPDLAARLREGGARTARSFTWTRIIAELDAYYRVVASRRIACGPASAWETVLDDAVATDPGAAQRLDRAAATTLAGEILVPVARPGIEGHDVVSWEAVARRRGGAGRVRVHAPHRSAARGTLPYQAGIDALDAERPELALSLFTSALRDAHERSRKGALLKWAALSLVELYRTDEGLRALESGITAFPDNPDYTYLAALVAPMTDRPIDLSRAAENIATIGAGTRYEDWLADPAGLLAARLGG